MATRRVISADEFFDKLDELGERGNEHLFVTIGYVTGANLNVPKIQKRNPSTNRLKKYDDYSVFQGDSNEEIGALVKITSYNFNWRSRKSVGKQYGEYKQAANGIRAKYGLEPIKDKSGYTQTMNYGSSGIDVYNGNNSALQNHSYNPQNMFGVKPKGVVYAVNTNGRIIKALSQDQVKPYLKAKSEADGVAALRKMGVDEQRIQEYIKELANLKMSYKNFESSSILWICATINGEKILYLNDKITRIINDISINKDDFIAVARERYKKDLAQLQEMINKYKNMIQLTEQQLYQVIKESTQRILSRMKKSLNEGVNNDTAEGGGYRYFAVSKINGKIINGWEGLDKELMKDDLIANEIDPHDVSILTLRGCMKYGIDPNDDTNWVNTVD